MTLYDTCERIYAIDITDMTSAKSIYGEQSDCLSSLNYLKSTASDKIAALLDYHYSFLPSVNIVHIKEQQLEINFIIPDSWVAIGYL